MALRRLIGKQSEQSMPQSGPWKPRRLTRRVLLDVNASDYRCSGALLCGCDVDQIYNQIRAGVHTDSLYRVDGSGTCFHPAIVCVSSMRVRNCGRFVTDPRLDSSTLIALGLAHCQAGSMFWPRCSAGVRMSPSAPLEDKGRATQNRLRERLIASRCRPPLQLPTTDS
jgi:hypothetical protein